jgi:hypothetical protein
MGNINISTATVKAYANKQRTINNERYPKQTQSNPIPPTQYAIRNTQYEIHATYKTTSPKRKRRGIHETTTPKHKRRGILGQFPDGHADKIKL